MHEIRQSFGMTFRYPVIFTRNAFDPENDALLRAAADAGRGPHRILPVIDSGVLDATPDLPARIESFFKQHTRAFEQVTEPLVVRGGEICKRDPVEVDALHRLIAKHGICRHSFVLAIGGGAVLDAMGYAAATAHRGVRLIRMPTTTLAQNDAGIGVKNAINLDERKNYVGTFSPPFAVVNDFAFLATLATRDLCAGIAEAVKVALVRDARFFQSLFEGRRALASFADDAMESMIIRSAELHLEHIRTSGDPFELGSARPLDFGHWAAHKLEEITSSALRHGEAVAIGIALDSLYSCEKDLLDEYQLQRILAVLEDVGFALGHPALAAIDIERALGDFREHLGGDLCITLLDGIGRGIEVGEIDVDCMRLCVAELLRGAHRRRDAGVLRRAGV